MTPKEIAEDLLKKFEPISNWYLDSDTKRTIRNNKECALAAVEFARDQFDKYCCAEINTNGTPNDHFDAIKEEIEKL
jgi:hypothetical protein